MWKLDKIIVAFREVVVSMLNDMLPQLMFVELNLNTTNCTYFFIFEKNLSFFPLHNIDITFQFLLDYNQDTCSPKKMSLEVSYFEIVAIATIIDFLGVF